MSATYYSQILNMFYWDKISKGMDVVAAEFRANQNIATFEGISDGGIEYTEEEMKLIKESLDKNVDGISYWAGRDMWLDENEFKVSVYIGSVMHFSPSGKFYMPWSTNVTEKEAEKDIAYWTAFEKVTDKFNMFGENGEGDPTDLFLTRVYDVAS